MKDLGPRPLCPDCKSTHVKSHGVYWGCVDCGRTFSKHYRGIFNRKKYEGANCPECFRNDEVISKGYSWYCKRCGRWFQKIKIVREQPIFDLKEVIRG